MITRDLSYTQKVRRRSLILGGIKSLFTIVVCGKLYYLQILNKSKYGKLSDLNRTKVKILYPERGVIFDKFGNPIASNRLDYQLTIFKEKKELINRYILPKIKSTFFFWETLVGLRETKGTELTLTSCQYPHSLRQSVG
mgnify:CR=1 FL=1